jgi:hypothetical protein
MAYAAVTSAGDNTNVSNMTVVTFQCPSDSSMVDGHPSGMANGGSSYACNYFSFGGVRYAPGGTLISFLGSSTNWFGMNRIPTTFQDGTSNTILFTEKYARCEYPPAKMTGGGNMWAHSGASWYPVVHAPDYKQYNPNCIGPNAGGLFQLQPLPFQGTGATCDFTLASTGHIGGIEVCLADASVRTVNSSISFNTWWDAITPAGNEPMPNDW